MIIQLPVHAAMISVFYLSNRRETMFVSFKLSILLPVLLPVVLFEGKNRDVDRVLCTYWETFRGPVWTV